MGDIGEKRKWIILEPLPEEAPVQEPLLVPAPEPEKVPA
jgi:hypothetical protein